MINTIQGIDVPIVYELRDGDEFLISQKVFDSDGLINFEEGKISFKNLKRNNSWNSAIEIFDPNSDVKIVANNNSYYIDTNKIFSNLQNQIQNMEYQITKLKNILNKNGIS